MTELDLKGFDLGEIGGGEQMIFASKPINDKEHYVLTLGDGPKSTDEVAQTEQNVNAQKSVGGQILDNLRNHIPGLNKNAQMNNKQEPNNIKLRCFKLSHVEGKKYMIEEYVTPKAISEVARFMRGGSAEQETER